MSKEAGVSVLICETRELGPIPVETRAPALSPDHVWCWIREADTNGRSAHSQKQSEEVLCWERGCMGPEGLWQRPELGWEQ